jgi:hypothetical protein
MGVNWLISNTFLRNVLDGAAYYWFFTLLMAAAAVAFVFVAWTYRGQSYIQEEVPVPASADPSSPAA